LHKNPAVTKYITREEKVSVCTDAFSLLFERGNAMQIKVAEIVGESKKDWQDAVKNAVKEASRDLGNISGVEVYNWTANCQDDQIIEYKANIKIAYTE